MKSFLPLVLILSTLNAPAQGFLPMDTLNGLPGELKPLIREAFYRGFKVDYDGDGKKDFIVEASNTPVYGLPEMEYWITSSLKVTSAKKVSGVSYDYYRFVNLDSDPEPEIYRADGDEDGIDYAMFDLDLKTGQESLLFYFNPVIVENGTQYWGYPWDTNAPVLKNENGKIYLQASVDHDIQRDDLQAYGQGKTYPTIFFHGHSTQPNAKVKGVRDIKWLTIDELVREPEDPRFVTFVADPAAIKFYWKDEHGQILKSIQSLKSLVESKNLELVFAMNGGMYTRTNAPQGLYIENTKIVTPLDTSSGPGNFYMKPNGVFYVTRDNKAIVSETEPCNDYTWVKFATQSGPMLVIDGKIHPAFKKGSTYLNIRNGVGILPGGSVLFAMSKQEVNFYDFAEFFKSQGCRDALYLDGFVSRMYLPEKNWKQLDGNFGVMIGVTK